MTKKAPEFQGLDLSLSAKSCSAPTKQCSQWEELFCLFALSDSFLGAGLSWEGSRAHRPLSALFDALSIKTKLLVLKQDHLPLSPSSRYCYWNNLGWFTFSSIFSSLFQAVFLIIFLMAVLSCYRCICLNPGWLHRGSFLKEEENENHNQNVLVFLG